MQFGSHYLLAVVLSLFISPVSSPSYKIHPGQQAFKWPEGKKMALSLTFDDGRLSQPDKGIPLLDKYNVKATFYIVPSAMYERLDGWKKAARN
jgi:peptidoglycan-N-acetylglucosamine deacetylase